MVVQQRVANEVSELSVHYENGPFPGAHQRQLQARIGTAAGGETPTVAWSAARTRRPSAGGARATDALPSPASPAPEASEALDTRRFNVLLFDGRSDSAEGISALRPVRRRRERSATPAVDALWSPRATRPGFPRRDQRGVRPRRRARGAATAPPPSGAYVLRLLTSVAGYRAQPLDEAKLLAWLDARLRPET